MFAPQSLDTDHPNLCYQWPTEHHIKVHPGQCRVVGPERAEEVRREKTTQNHSLQDHQHHYNSNNHQQSTDNQPLQDLQQQIQLQLTFTRPTTAITTHFYYFKTIFFN